MKRPRILQIITSLANGGSARCVIETSRLLLGEFDVAIAFGPGEEHEGSLRGEAAEAGVPLFEIPSLRERGALLQDRRALREIDERIRGFGPALIHTHHDRAGTLGRMAAQRSGVRRAVHTFHASLPPLDRPSPLIAPDAGLRRVARGADRLIAVSPSLKNDLVRYKIAPPERVEVIQPLAEPRRLLEAPPPATLRKQIGISPDFPLLGLVGRLTPAKDAQLFLHALAIVAKSIPETRAAIVGDGPERPALEAAAAHLGIREKVFFVGWQRDTRPVYPDLEIVLVTSKREGFALSALEAMAAGRPVVGTRVPGVADIVEHERTGLLAPSGDAAGLAGAVILLLSDAAYRSRLAAAGREAAAGFAKAGAAPRIAALYRNLLKPQAGEARDAGGSPSI